MGHKIDFYNEGYCTRRIVEIFISDPDQSVPLEDVVLYHAERFTTELSDSELFMKIDITALVDEHNKKRVLWPDKRFRESVVMLEEIKPRALKFTVINVVQL